MRTKLKTCESILDQLNVSGRKTNAKLNEVKEMLQDLRSSRSDERVLGDGVKTLKEQLEKHKSTKDVEKIFKTTSDNLDGSYATVQRIMNKFGKPFL